MVPSRKRFFDNLCLDLCTPHSEGWLGAPTNLHALLHVVYVQRKYCTACGSDELTALAQKPWPACFTAIADEKKAPDDPLRLQYYNVRFISSVCGCMAVVRQL